MDETDGDNTLPSPPTAGRGRGGGGERLLLTLAFHPETDRIGAWSSLPVPGGSGRLTLGRDEPAFSGPAQDGCGTIADRHVSRLALTLARRGDRWLLERPAGSSRCRVDGRELYAERIIDGAELRRGLRLLLGHGVLLLLRLLPAGDGDDPAPPLPGLLGESPYARDLRRQIGRLAASDGDVLLRGPTGTGKELVARALHAASSRAAGPLVAVNVAAIPPELAAAQLFGASRGAYTGAERAHRGYFEQASGGTLFLDEIGDAPPALQPQLLRALEQREIQVVGGPIRPVDLRVISATDAPIDERGADFSRALRHRLGALELRLRPLVEHREDIGTLAAHYLRDALATTGRQRLWTRVAEVPARLAACAELFDRLLAYHWPGNIRELANVARQVAVSCGDHFELPPLIAERLEAPPEDHPDADGDGGPGEVSEADFAAAWAANQYEVASTARALGLSRTAVYRRVRDLPGCRLAGDIPMAELLETLAASRGDLEAAAQRLCVSQAGLRARLRAAGETAGGER